MPTYIVKGEPNVDWYVMWSTVVDTIVGYGTRAELEAALEPREVEPARFVRADRNGTSAAWIDWPEDDMPFGWNDKEFAVMEVEVDGDRREQEAGCYLLPRVNLRAFTEALAENRIDVGHLLRFEVHDDEATPPPPGVAAGASPGGPVEYRSKDDPDRCTSNNRDGIGGQIVRCVLHREHVALREEHTSAQGRTWPVAVRETPISDAAGAGGGES